MAQQLDGRTIALERIAKEAEEKTGSLDLGNLGLTELPAALFALEHLEELNLGSPVFDDERILYRFSAKHNPNKLDHELSQLVHLPKLRRLSLSLLPLHDLTPLANLKALQSLSYSQTQVDDLTPLAHLTALQSLNCSATKISDLTPLANLTALQSLSCSHTLISDLTPLTRLTALQSLSCSAPRISDLAPLANLTALQSLTCSYTQISDLAPLANLTALQSLNCSSTQISDLTPLANLKALQSLHCFETQISDLTPLANLEVLHSLNCSRTQISDLIPLANLKALQSLDCFGTQISDLTPLANLEALQSLSCGGTQISDLTPLANLEALQSLSCAGTQISDLIPLANLEALQSLDCFGTQISDLTPLANLEVLHSLNCSRTQISDLTPLANITTLKSFECSGTAIADLTPLMSLPKFESLNCDWCVLKVAPNSLWHKETLTFLNLWDTTIPGIPSELLSQNNYDNCLDSLRAHLTDLRSGSELITDSKLMVLGNGRIGKTQICRRLRGSEFDEGVSSTHGIVVSSADIPQSDSDAPIHLHLWDFGGQDIYHGAHALFMRTRAIFLLAWTPESDQAAEHEHDGMIFRNQPLAYWLDYVRYLSGPSNPLLIVQTRCDRPEDEIKRLPVTDDALDDFGFCKTLQYSSLNNRGRAALDEALQDAWHWLREQQGSTTIGAGRLRVQKRLEAMRDADAAVLPAERQYRTLSQEHFQNICMEEGGVSSPEQLLNYLHNSGIIFYRQALFDDQIILDQEWALEAIYAVFHRQHCYRQLKQLRGRFTRSLLALLVWQDYGIEEQELFLSMMQSCGICFVHHRGYGDNHTETEYIAPDLLPDKTEVAAELMERWDNSIPSETAKFEYELHQPALLRSFVAQIGNEAGINALYWRNGVCVYEQGTRSRALIEQETLEGWRGIIRLQTQGGQAAALLEKLTQRLMDEQWRWGITDTSSTKQTKTRRIVELSTCIAGTEVNVKEQALTFVQEKSAQPEYCISYAWCDRTPEGKEREVVVNQLCDEAGIRGITIIRDKTALGLGDSISKFMQRIGKADRAFVILSEKYLRSPFCMFELFEVWRNCHHDEDAFLQRIRIYTLPCAKIFTPLDRAQFGVYWKQQHDELAAIIKEYGADVLGENDFKRFKLMQDFAHRVGDVLSTIADVVQPRTFEELAQYGLEGLSNPK